MKANRGRMLGAVVMSVTALATATTAGRPRRTSKAHRGSALPAIADMAVLRGGLFARCAPINTRSDANCRCGREPNQRQRGEPDRPITTTPASRDGILKVPYCRARGCWQRAIDIAIGERLRPGELGQSRPVVRGYAFGDTPPDGRPARAFRMTRSERRSARFRGRTSRQSALAGRACRISIPDWRCRVREPEFAEMGETDGGHGHVHPQD